MPDRIIRFVLTGDSKGAVKAMQDTSKASEQTAKDLDKTGKKSKEASEKTDLLEKSTRRLHSSFRLVASASGIGGLYFGLKDAIGVASEFQQQQAQLQAALKSTGNTSARTLGEVNDAIEASSLHGGFKGVDETQGVSRFIRQTQDASKAIKLNTEAVDLARGGNMSYADAVNVVSQAQTGHVGRLQKLLGNIAPVTYYTRSLTAAQKEQNPEVLKHAKALDAQATAAEANRRIMGRYGTATAAYGHTAAGALSNAQHAFEQLAEKIGTLLLPYVTKAEIALGHVADVVIAHWPQIVARVKSVVDWFKRHHDIVMAVAAATAVLVGALETMKVLITVTKFIKETSAAMKVLNISMEANPIGLVVVALAALAAGFVYAYEKSSTFRRIVNGALHAVQKVVGEVVGFVTKHWKLLAPIIAGPLAPILELVTHLRQVKHLVGDITGGGAAHAIGHFAKHPFGLATGGLVPGYATGGMIGTGTDTVPIMATKGEYMIRKEVVDTLGARTLNDINRSGQLPDTGPDVIDVHTHLHLDSRPIAESVTRFSLKMGARRGG